MTLRTLLLLASALAVFNFNKYLIVCLVYDMINGAADLSKRALDHCHCLICAIHNQKEGRLVFQSPHVFCPSL